MKKVFLIDDNIDGTRGKYGGSFVDEGEYSEVLHLISRPPVYADIEELKDAACVLIHRSCKGFATINDILEMGTTIPYVIFSDGDTSDMGDYRPENPMVIYSLSKRAFFGRLEGFISHYASTGIIDLRILAFGTDFKKVLLEKSVTAVFSIIQEFGNDEIVPTKVHCKDMRQIVDLAQPKIGKSYEEIITDLQLNPITIGEFKKRINNILDNFQNYGKNYYTWE